MTAAPIRVALADDQSDVRMLLRRLLAREGLDVVAEAADGIETLQLVEDHDPDVLVLDLSMPRMDGLEVLEELAGRARPAVVVLTGFEDPDLDRAARHLGAVDVLHKGSDFKALCQRIRAACPPGSGDARGDADPSPPVQRRSVVDETRKDRLEHLRLILDTANDAFIGIDEHGDVIDWNRRAEELFGWSCEEVEGRSLAELIIPEEHREAHRRGIARFLATGEGHVLYGRLDMPAHDRAGRRLDVELTIWPSRMGGRWRFNAFLRDVTELRRERQYVQLLADVTEDANAAMSTEAAVRRTLGKVCAAMGWPVGHAWLVDPGDQVTRSSGWWHRTDPQAFEEFVAATDDLAFLPGEGLPGRVVASGEPHWVVDVQEDDNFPRLRVAAMAGLHSAVAFPVKIADRSVAVLEFYSIHRYEVDQRTSQLLSSLGTQLGRVFERVRALQEAHDAQRFKGRMLATLSHDLKAPAGAVSGLAALLEEGLGDGVSVDDRELVAGIRRQADQISHLVSELLTVERLDAGALPHEPEDVEVVSLIGPAIEDLAPEARVEMAVGLRAHVDRAHLVRMVTNLVNNARRHGEPPVTVTADGGPDVVTIAVEDRGPGIPPDLAERLFEPFAATTTTGTGLGLSIVHGLARLNGGDVRYEPVEPSGARFVLTLPARRPS